MEKDKDQIIEKIKKCLALSKSSNEHEAALAMQKAQEMMEKHSVDSIDIEISYVDAKDTEMSKTVKPPRHLALLAMMIAEVFGCHVVVAMKYSFTKSCNLSPRNIITFIGLMQRSEIAAYAFDVLRKQLVRARKLYIKKHPQMNKQTVTRRADLFAEAWVHGARSKVTPLFVGEREKEIIEAYKFKAYGDNIKDGELKKRKKKQRGDDDAIYEGYMNGKDADIYHGVKDSEKTLMIQ